MPGLCYSMEMLQINVLKQINDCGSISPELLSPTKKNLQFLGTNVAPLTFNNKSVKFYSVISPYCWSGL